MKPRLLLVEDDEALRHSLEHFLQHDFDVVACESVAKAQASIDSAEPIDVLITDFMLGDGDGLHVAELVRLRSANVPIILITGSPSDLDRIGQLLAMPGTTLISKPFHMEALEQALASHI